MIKTRPLLLTGRFQRDRLPGTEWEPFGNQTRRNASERKETVSNNSTTAVPMFPCLERTIPIWLSRKETPRLTLRIKRSHVRIMPGVPNFESVIKVTLFSFPSISISDFKCETGFVCYFAPNNLSNPSRQDKIQYPLGEFTFMLKTYLVRFALLTCAGALLFMTTMQTESRVAAAG